MTLTDRIEDLARLYEARDGGGQAELWAWSTAVDDDWPKLLPVLRAAVAYVAAAQANIAARELPYQPGTPDPLLVTEPAVILAHAALVAAVEEATP